MSEPSIFSIVRDGEPRHYFDRWGGILIFRHLVWGEQAVVDWISGHEEVDQWTDDVAGGLVLDFDRRVVVWSGDDEVLEIPRVRACFHQLVSRAWPGFEIKHASRGVMDLAEALGHDDVDDYDDESAAREETLESLVEYYADEDATDEDGVILAESIQFPDASDGPVAWIALIEASGAVRHRQLPEIPWDVLKLQPQALLLLATLPSADLPREAEVKEGLWIDHSNHEVGAWGGPATQRDFDQVDFPSGWEVRWVEQGYGEQCAASGPAGIPMSDAEALGKILPVLLSTKRVDLQNMVGALGNQLKSSAIKATGCLVVLLSLPVLLLGWAVGNTKAAWIVIGIMIVMATLIFKLIEFRMKRTFRNATRQDDESMPAPDAPAVAGPLEKQARKAELDKRLQECGLPNIAACQQHIESPPELGDLL